MNVTRQTDAPALADLLGTVERLRPIIEEHAAAAEADRHLAEPVYRAMFDAGLFAMTAPRAYGGLELPITEILTVWEAVARIDSAAGWNLVMGQGIPPFAAWLPAEGAKELFAEGPTTVAGALFPPAAARRVEGGWRITGQVPFASGCHHTTWLAMPAVEVDTDGQPMVDPTTGEPAPFGAFIPRADAEILDTWHTVGMRGTGSADFRVRDVFVPDSRTMQVAPLAVPAPGFEGPLYRLMPFTTMLGEATVSVGIAASALDAAVELARTKVPAYQATALRDQQLAQHGLGRALGRVNAGRDTLHRAAAEGHAEAEAGPLSPAMRARLQTACSYAAEISAEAVRVVADVVGTSSIRIGQPFERHLRDTQVLVQHASKSTPRYASAGRLMVGLDADWIFLSF